MKRFSLDEYLKNPSRKVVTREGRNARIICTDFKTKHHSDLALVDYGKYECTISCSKEGKHYTGERESPNDLFFAPEKHEGWVNIFKCNNFYHTEDELVYNSKEEAEIQGKNYMSYIDTVKIEWEE